MKGAKVGIHSILVLVGFLVFLSVQARAQSVSPRPAPSPRPLDSVSAGRSSSSEDRGPLTTFEEEIRAKRAIKLAEKEHQENLNRAREISQLGRQLQDSVKNKTTLSRDETRKLERLEKLTKKIRGEAGGGSEDIKIENPPSDVSSAVTQIAETADSLSKGVQRTPRQVVSATVIGRANVLLELIRIVRGFTSQP